MEPQKREVVRVDSGEYDAWSRAVLSEDGGRCRGCGADRGAAPRVIVPLGDGGSLITTNGMTMCSPCWLEFDGRFRPSGSTTRTSVVLDKALYAEFQRQGGNLSKLVTFAVLSRVRLQAAQSISQGRSA